MIKSKRKANKKSIIEGSRRYTVISTADIGGLQHYFPLGTVVKRDPDDASLFTDFERIPMHQHMRPGHYQ